MSVNTAADEKINKAKEHISRASKELLNVLDKDCWGNSNLNDDYIEEIETIVISLLKMNRKL